MLVVIGILIALQINTAYTNKKNRQMERNYLIAIRDDLDLMTDNLNSHYLDRLDRKIEGLFLGKQYVQDQLVVFDTLSFLSKVSYGGVGSGGLVVDGKNTYRELVSTGGLRLISNDGLRQNISKLYNLVDSREKILETFNSGYANFINSLRPFDYERPAYIEQYDQIEMMKALKNHEFAQKVDFELTYAYKLKIDCNMIINEVNLLQEQLSKELKQ